MIIFPARVDFGEGQIITKAKVMEHDSSVFIYGLDDNRKPLELAEIKNAQLTRAGRMWKAIGQLNGEAIEVVVERDSGCGCSHPLKKYNPFAVNRVGT